MSIVNVLLSRYYSIINVQQGPIHAYLIKLRSRNVILKNIALFEDFDHRFQKSFFFGTS